MRDNIVNKGNSRMQARDGSLAACLIGSGQAFQGTGRLLEIKFVPY